MIGFEFIKSEIIKSYQANKLHHAILLHGKKGIGKSNFAKKIAQELTNNYKNNNPDVFVIEKDAEKKEIGIDKIRSIKDFVNQTSAVSLNKFIIIDSACELNKSSSNALLKVLEEPRPNNFLILVAHNINRVLPTLISRCHLITAPQLTRADFNQVLAQNNLNFSAQDLNFLSEICDNAPADAITFGNNLARFYELFLRSVVNKKISPELLKQIADKNFSFVIFEKLVEFFCNRLSKTKNNIAIDFYFEEEKVFLNLTRKFSAEEIFTICDESYAMLRKTTNFNLDKKLCFINFFNLICYR